MRLYIICSVVIASFVFAPSATYAFDDVGESYWAAGYIGLAIDGGIMRGYSDETFGPDNTLTRSETVKIILAALDITPTDTPAESSFPDVALDHSLRTYIEEAKKRQIIAGYEDGTFGPNRSVTRAEFTKILITAADKLEGTMPRETFSDVDASAWYAPFVKRAVALRYVRGYQDGTFKPDRTITRAEAAKIIIMFDRKGIVPDFEIAANSTEEKYILDKINASRAAVGKNPLTLNARISMIARAHSQDLATHYQTTDKVIWQEEHAGEPLPWTSHDSTDGTGFEDRFRTASAPLGIAYRVASENVAWATFKSRTIEEALTAMHEEMVDLPDATNAAEGNQKSNLLSQYSNFSEIGIGIVIDAASQEIIMTQAFVELP